MLFYILRSYCSSYPGLALIPPFGLQIHALRPMRQASSEINERVMKAKLQQEIQGEIEPLPPPSLFLLMKLLSVSFSVFKRLLSSSEDLHICCLCSRRFEVVLQDIYMVFHAFQDQDGKSKKANIQDNRDGTYKVSYVPDKVGRYTIVIKYGGDEIPTSPYRVRATTTGDASKCTVTGKSTLVL